MYLELYASSIGAREVIYSGFFDRAMPIQAFFAGHQQYPYPLSVSGLHVSCLLSAMSPTSSEHRLPSPRSPPSLSSYRSCAVASDCSAVLSGRFLFDARGEVSTECQLTTAIFLIYSITLSILYLPVCLAFLNGMWVRGIWLVLRRRATSMRFMRIFNRSESFP